MLQDSSGNTFTSWAKDQGLTGAPQRELATDARAMDLAVVGLGVGLRLATRGIAR